MLFVDELVVASLDHLIGSVFQLPGDEGPLAPMLSVQLEDQVIFCLGPLGMADTDDLIVSATDLSACPFRQGSGRLYPIPLSMLLHMPSKHCIVPLSPLKGIRVVLIHDPSQLEESPEALQLRLLKDLGDLFKAESAL